MKFNRSIVLEMNRLCPIVRQNQKLHVFRIGMTSKFQCKIFQIKDCKMGLVDACSDDMGVVRGRLESNRGFRELVDSREKRDRESDKSNDAIKTFNYEINDSPESPE